MFGPFDTAKEVWDYLAATNTVSDLASQYQIDLDLHRLRKTAAILALPSSNQNVLAIPTGLATSSCPPFRKKWCDFHKWGFHSNDECKQNLKKKNSVLGCTPPRLPSQPATVVTDTAVSDVPSSSSSTPTIELTTDELAVISNNCLSQTGNSNGISASSFPSSSACSVASGRVDWEGLILVLLYVDDMIITSDNLSSIRTLKISLSQQFEMKDLGDIRHFLGLEVTSHHTGYFLSQIKYASDLVSKFGVSSSDTVISPKEENWEHSTLTGEPLSDPTYYRQLVGSLIYLTVTRRYCLCSSSG
ncbi:hypothetical protein RJ639_009259 [Escallonia herrerae]|uniref:Reverse transcriptase Ty1/copia-type domain-containing protein n=1 Tax=Escallonia herrerae TaxID=1293975 RepID=A0AA88VTB8_9ASTE|nr:hypothetical protein RJ639_009259 [Escallonia herrerae]